MADSGRKVLLAVCADETSENAVQWYLNNVAREGDTVVGISVVEYNVRGIATSIFKKDDPIEISKQFTLQKTAFEKACYKFTQMLKDHKGVKVFGKFEPVELSEQKTGEVIIKKAVESDVSCIIMGTRGLGPIKRAFLGSVSQYVMNHSPPCPVTVVPFQK